jgi:IS5 family transposase
MKAHIGVDAESGLVHTVIGTSGNVNDIVPANSLLHGEEDTVFADSGYRGAHKRPDANAGVTWHIAVRPSDPKRSIALFRLSLILLCHELAFRVCCPPHGHCPNRAISL